MWWCCGKRDKDAAGCKFSKHESKEDDDLEEDEEYGYDVTKGKKYVRCMCCKQLGHTIENCFRDPNFKTDVDLIQDQDRLSKLKDFRKLHADTTIQTTHFIKKAVMIPIEQDDYGQFITPEN